MTEKEAQLFIHFFTHRNDLTFEQKKKLDYLIARDCTIKSNPIESKSSNDPKEHSPKKMVEFLSLFSRDDRFKWFTHKWDQTEPLNIDKMIENLRRYKKVLFDMVRGPGPVVNEKTYNQVWNFIQFDEGDWFWTNAESENVKIRWNSVVGLSREKPDTPIENLKLSDGKMFKDYIRMFKGCIEFRTDLGDDYRFSEYIRNMVQTFTSDSALSLQFTDDFDNIGYGMNIYCDVVSLRAGISIVCDWIKAYKVNGVAVEIGLEEYDDGYGLIVFHKDSYFSNRGKLENPSGDFATLRKRLFSVCDFRMEGDFKSNNQLQNTISVLGLTDGVTLTGKKMSSCTINEYADKKIGGIKYIFKLYK